MSKDTPFPTCKNCGEEHSEMLPCSKVRLLESGSDTAVHSSLQVVTIPEDRYGMDPLPAPCDWCNEHHAPSIVNCIRIPCNTCQRNYLEKEGRDGACEICIAKAAPEEADRTFIGRYFMWAWRSWGFARICNWGEKTSDNIMDNFDKAIIKRLSLKETLLKKASRYGRFDSFAFLITKILMWSIVIMPGFFVSMAIPFIVFWAIYLLTSIGFIAAISGSIIGLIYLGIKIIGFGIFWGIPLFTIGCLIYVFSLKLPEKADESRGPYR